MRRSEKRLQRRTRILQFALLILTVLISSTPVAAQYANGGAFATRGYRGRTPLNVTYTLEMAPSMAVAALKVKIVDSAGLSKVDRKLTVVLYTQNYGQVAEDSLAYRKEVEIAEGATGAQIEILFPASEAQFAWDIGVFEEGRDIEDKRKSKNSNQQEFHWSLNYNLDMTSVGALIPSAVDPKVESPNLKAVTTYLDTTINSTALARAGVVAGSGVVSSPSIPVDQASDDWRRYFSYPVWIASVEAVAEINKEQPQVATALRTYISAGGALWVYRVNSSESMATVNRLLSGLGGNAELASWQSVDKVTPPWWILDSEVGTKQPAVETDNKQTKAIEGAGVAYDAALLTDTLLETGLGSHRDNLNDMMSVLGFDDVSLELLQRGRSRLLNSLGSEKLLEREFGQGRVIICNRSLDELDDSEIGAVIVPKNNIAAACALTARSHDGNWYWRNLIIEVGKPPVWAFCVIVALFGALLGPGLLTFTGRIQRRSLMIFLVPTVSFLATLAIILYGVLHEGFETYVRIHSVTAYDGPAQVAFGWSRQNYFSGLPPREGLQFSADTYARSVLPDDATNFRSSPDPRRNVEGMVSFGQKQTWNDWLKPRQHQQLLIGHKVDPRTIPISTQRSAAGKLVVKNLTAQTLPLVVLRGDKDDYYLEADLGSNESREPEVQDLESVSIVVSRIGVDYKPKIPQELEGGSDSLLNFGNPRRYARSFAVQETEMIDEAFKRYLSDDLDLAPHQFATLVPEFDAIEIPLKGIQSDNVNLVIGVDPW
ncbi:MAG: hypothetical protein SFV81_27195 [Pirellulaceae bacterium]|nr:hypothetical protein [Pirellulaceae bacterium]